MLVKRILIAAQYGCKVELYTNASHLSSSVTSEIAKIGNTRMIVNIPDGDPIRYAAITGRNAFNEVLQNLKYASIAGIPIDIVVNAKRGQEASTVARVTNAFYDISKNVSLWCTDNRAGILEPSEFISKKFEHNGILNGCLLATININVDSQGNVFMCAQDYDQSYKIGSLIKDSLSSIIEGDQCWLFRQYLFGLKNAPKDFICRKCDWTNTRLSTSGFRQGNERKLEANQQAVKSLLENGGRVKYLLN